MKWYVPEAGSRAAATILGSGVPLLAPDLIVAELGNIVWKKLRKGEVTAAEAAEIVHTFASFCPVTLVPSLHLAEPALSIAAAFGRSVYDALYVALAAAHDIRLITADVRLYHALQGTPFGRFVSLLA